MNKLSIPAFLAATIMVAGIFAFMPVEQASTVHTQFVQDTQLEIQVLTDNDDIDTDGQIEIECNRPFVLYTLFVTMANVVDGDVIAIIDVEIDEDDLVSDPAGDGVIASLPDIFLVNDPGAGGSALVSREVASTFHSGGDLAFPLGANADIDFILGAAVGIADGDDITVTAVVLAENGATCNINVEVAD